MTDDPIQRQPAPDDGPTPSSAPDAHEPQATAPPPLHGTPPPAYGAQPSPQQPYPQPPYPQPPYPHQPYPQPPYPQQPPVGYAHYGQPGYGPSQQSNGKATTSMVLGIVGLASILLCYGILGIVLGPLAFFIGRSAQSEIDPDPSR